MSLWKSDSTLSRYFYYWYYHYWYCHL